MSMNEVFSALSVRRRYEVWFVRMGLADRSGAWWFRYLLMNPGRGGCLGDQRGMPVQVNRWVTRLPESNEEGVLSEGRHCDLSCRASSPEHGR
jgi:hypothetical protein